MKRTVSAILLCLAMMLCGCQEGGRTNRDSADSDFEQSLDVGFNENEVSESTFSGDSTAAVSSSESMTASSISSTGSSVSLPTVPIEPSVSTSAVSSSGIPQTSTSVSSTAISSETSKHPLSSSVSTEEVVPPQSVPVNVPITDTSIDENAVPAVPEEPPVSSEPAPPEEAPIVSSSVESSDASPVENTNVVYIAASGNGTRYHRTPSCSNMKGTVELDEQTALNKGYTPCKKCW